jgi:hypothetical protein
MLASGSQILELAPHFLKFWIFARGFNDFFLLFPKQILAHVLKLSLDKASSRTALVTSPTSTAGVRSSHRVL